MRASEHATFIGRSGLKQIYEMVGERLTAHDYRLIAILAKLMKPFHFKKA